MVEAPIRFHYFAWNDHKTVLWNLTLRYGSDIEAFLTAVSQIWQRQRAHAPAADPHARAEVEALCHTAYQHIQAGQPQAAQTLLRQALARNDQARSPLVYQYLTNLAVLGHDLFVAVQAQKEALRLDPSNRLYRRNLLHLLTVPYAQRSRLAQPAAADQSLPQPER